MFNEEEAMKALASIKDSGSNRSVLELGWLEDVRINSPKAIVRLCLPSYAQSQRDSIASEIKRVLESFNEIQNLFLDFL